MSNQEHPPAGPHVHSSNASGARTALGWALALNGGFLIIEAIAGWWTGSLALISDAVHMVSDVAALALAYAVSRVAQSAATSARTYGLVGAETLGAFVNGLALVGAAVFILVEAVERLTTPPGIVDGWPVIVVGTVGLAINLGSAFALMRADNQSLNVRGALLHMMADALGSVGAVVAGVFLIYGWPRADPAIAVGIAGLVLWGTWGLLRESTGILLQFAPASQSTEEVLDALQAVPAVESVHDLHVWTLDGRETILSAHLLAIPGAGLETVRVEAETLLRDRFSITHTTLQTEADDGCESDCQVWSTEPASEEDPGPKKPTEDANDQS